MKKRTLAYIKKCKARRIIQNPLTADLSSFLAATLELSRSNIVKKHIRQSIEALQSPTWYKLSA
jgi:hypothetical protein